MIRSSSIEGHHFLISRRRGYDRDEVDAVMKRLAATLRMYEERDGGSGASEITMLEAARRARSEHTAELPLTEELQQRAAAEMGIARQGAEEILERARNKAEGHVQIARAEAAAIAARRNERSEGLVTAALTEVKALRSRALREINEYEGSKRSEAESLIRTAEMTSEDLIEDARREAGAILGRARREHTELERRLAHLRTAIATIEGQFRNLAESTLEQTEIVASMISMETENIAAAAEDREPEVVRLTQPGMTIDLTDQAEKAEVKETDPRYAVAPGSTIYERRGGGIRHRLEDDYQPPTEDA